MFFETEIHYAGLILMKIIIRACTHSFVSGRELVQFQSCSRVCVGNARNRRGSLVRMYVLIMDHIPLMRDDR